MMLDTLLPRNLGTLLAGALMLSACSKLPNNDCLDLPVDPPSGVTDLRQEVYVCVERNAAIYAKGPDSPEALSRAVIAKCKPTINRFLEQEGQAADLSLPYNIALEQWRQHSLPTIAEARARGCYS